IDVGTCRTGGNGTKHGHRCVARMLGPAGCRALLGPLAIALQPISAARQSAPSVGAGTLAAGGRAMKRIRDQRPILCGGEHATAKLLARGVVARCFHTTVVTVFLLAASQRAWGDDPTSRYIALPPIPSLLPASSTGNAVQFEIWDQASGGTQISTEAHTVDTDS